MSKEYIYSHKMHLTIRGAPCIAAAAAVGQWGPPQRLVVVYLHVSGTPVFVSTMPTCVLHTDPLAGCMRISTDLPGVQA